MTFISRAFSEPDGTPSFSRLATLLFILATIGWGTFIVYKKEAIPDMSGIALVIAALYGLNKAAAAAESFSKK